jgi:hypothetical protein
MPVSSFPATRRDFLAGAARGLGAALAAPSIVRGAVDAPAKPRVAAVFTEMRHRSHAHVILENFLEPYLFNGQRTHPGVEIVSLYADQRPHGDMTHDVAAQYGIEIAPTIDEALCRGRGSLAVDAVLSIGEHGNYPRNDRGQIEYPRKRFFDEIVRAFERSGRVVPLFNDKHLSYRWDWAREMYDTARRLGIPFMAGSSVPLAERRPALELPAGARVVEAISVHGGPVESYDFHGLEVLQSLVEFREGGETGIARVQFLSGDALWQAANEGRWSSELLAAALAAELGPDQPPPAELAARLTRDEQAADSPHGILVEYRDGLRAMVLGVGRRARRWGFACRLADESAPRATTFHTGPWNNRNLFKALAHAIQSHFQSGQAPYPVERTLLATGALAAAMESRHADGAPQETPHLDVAYVPRDFTAFRETGATWQIVTEDMPEPHGMTPDTVGR